MTKEFTPEQSLLGRATEYRSNYAPELLFPILRQQKRDELGIASGALPFVGEDLWNAYEISWLNLRGKPQVALGVFRIPATSPYLIESKSLKLYLNSFNQTGFADVVAVRECVRRDLSAAAGASVAVEIHSLDEQPIRHYAYPNGACVDGLDVEINCYQPTPALLRTVSGHEVEDELLYSHLLKSNCLVTGQPDWGTVMIRYSGAALDREALLRYVVSFREHNEFHEQCVERIYTDIMAQCAPRKLAVWARYTRRGGLDINPFRASEAGWGPDNVFEVRQ
ncbi:NADPH-dependent 7-cyano-7-deazaguanine reductase QueF [Uliginosibacterium gangwonense]|uniref:NADPH-dependent 7-cyano-7-deazaguanine reductase QueF n=1 Tax=Uliginosibacterium gangwonense TaxID=392736 RepID=UPI000365C36E|nr:NADPH-dependent 7-cyano-7-deazaguanine reductase QueF [Uliginosibacterium gangwonense]